MNYREAWANGDIEAGTLVDRIEEQALEIERLEAEIEDTLVGWGAVRLELAALKAQPSGVVLPERKAQRITDAYAAGFNACLDEVARLNQPANAGDERAAFELWWASRPHRKQPAKFANGDYCAPSVHSAWATWQARAALSANHSEQVRALVGLTHCQCGDSYPANSYDAGFIDGSGMCVNCDAAIPARDLAREVVAYRDTVSGTIFPTLESVERYGEVGRTIRPLYYAPPVAPEMAGLAEAVDKLVTAHGKALASLSAYTQREPGE